MFFNWYAKGISDVRIACSQSAGQFAFGNSKFTVVNNGIDVNKFKFDPKIRESVRKKLGLGTGLVIICVGRLERLKNQGFLIEVFREIIKEKKDAKLVLCGDGVMRQELEERVKTLGFEKSVLFLGVREDVNEIMMASDVYCFPSIAEGLGIVAIEAQASGLPVVASYGVPRDAAVTDIVTFLGLDDGVEKWAQSIIQASGKKVERAKYGQKIIDANYDKSNAFNQLGEIYNQLGVKK